MTTVEELKQAILNLPEADSASGKLDFLKARAGVADMSLNPITCFTF